MDITFGSLLIFISFIFLLAMLRVFFINIYKVGYYETKLDLKGYDIEKIKNIKLFDITLK